MDGHFKFKLKKNFIQIFIYKPQTNMLLRDNHNNWIRNVIMKHPTSPFPPEQTEPEDGQNKTGEAKDFQ